MLFKVLLCKVYQLQLVVLITGWRNLLPRKNSLVNISQNFNLSSYIIKLSAQVLLPPLHILFYLPISSLVLIYARICSGSAWRIQDFHSTCTIELFYHNIPIWFCRELWSYCSGTEQLTSCVFSSCSFLLTFVSSTDNRSWHNMGFFKPWWFCYYGHHSAFMEIWNQ